MKMPIPRILTEMIGLFLEARGSACLHGWVELLIHLGQHPSIINGPIIIYDIIHG